MRGKAKALIQELRKVANAEAEVLTKEIEMGRQRLGLPKDSSIRERSLKVAAARVATRRGVYTQKESPSASPKLTKSASTPDLRDGGPKRGAAVTRGLRLSPLPGGGSSPGSYGGPLSHSASAPSLMNFGGVRASTTPAMDGISSSRPGSASGFRTFTTLSGHPDMTLSDFDNLLPKGVGKLGALALQSANASASSALESQQLIATQTSALRSGATDSSGNLSASFSATQRTLSTLNDEVSLLPGSRKIVKPEEMERIQKAKEEMRHAATAQYLKSAVPAMTLTARTLQMWAEEKKAEEARRLDSVWNFRIEQDDKYFRRGERTALGGAGTVQKSAESAEAAVEVDSEVPASVDAAAEVAGSQTAQGGVGAFDMVAGVGHDGYLPEASCEGATAVTASEAHAEASTDIISPAITSLMFSAYPGLDQTLQRLRATKLQQKKLPRGVVGDTLVSSAGRAAALSAPWTPYPGLDTVLQQLRQTRPRSTVN